MNLAALYYKITDPSTLVESDKCLADLEKLISIE